MLCLNVAAFLGISCDLVFGSVMMSLNGDHFCFQFFGQRRRPTIFEMIQLILRIFLGLILLLQISLLMSV